jgi:ubiquitin carboxyl-terminal hydrolase L3
MTPPPSSEKKWLPLESNPDVMARFLHATGVPAGIAVSDIYGTDPELLAMVPGPVHAVLLLFPISPQTEAARAEQAERDGGEARVPAGCVYLRQTIGNACGTIAMLHAVANSPVRAAVAPASFFDQFLKETDGMDPAARGAWLERSDAVEAVHAVSAQEGQSDVPPEDQDIDLHFVALVESGGRLLELDGRKHGPIDHGAVEPGALLADAVGVVRREFMDKDPENLKFTLLAITGDL